jgi:hypothetical protein
LLSISAAFGTNSELSRLQFCVDIEILEKEYILTEAQYMLSTLKSSFDFSGIPETTHRTLLLEFIEINTLISNL